MGLEFIDRSLRTTGVVLLIFLPFGLYYLGLWPCLAVFSGGIWGMINLIFISALVRSTLRPDGVDKLKTLGLALFKFPLLYLSGYFLLIVPQFQPLYLLCGFSAIFLIMVLKALGIAMTRANDGSGESDQARGLA